MGFFTDTSLCIGCKACEVACKEWNEVPEDGLDFLGLSMDNTGALGADTWRHVAFVEQQVQVEDAAEGLRWLMSSDVCKHCTHAACLEVCPTGSLFRTEFGTVVVQEDICNGCGYCVPACPFGVLDRREEDGRVWKCTLCYDRLERRPGARLREGVPDRTRSSSAPLDELRAHAERRVVELHERGEDRRAAVPATTRTTGSAGAGAFFLLLDEPGGLRAAAGSGRHDARPRRDVAARRRGAAAALAAGVAGALLWGRR